MSALRRESVNSSNTSVTKSGSSRTVSCRFCAIRSMKSSAVCAPASWLFEPLHAQLAVAAHGLDEQLLLGAEVVVQQPPRDAGLARDVVEGRAGGAAPRDAACASPRRCAAPSRPTASARRRSRRRGAAALAGALLHGVGLCDDGVHGGGHRVAVSSRISRRRRLGAGSAGSGGRAVVELLLGAEQQVEHLRAQALAERDREHAGDGEQQQRASHAAAAAALGRLTQRSWRRRAARSPPP